MLFVFSKHTLEKSEDGYILTLYIDKFDCEFANDFNSRNTSDTLNKSIIAYIKKNLTNIKISIIKVIMGGVLILTISIADLESSFKISSASTIYAKEQVNKAINNTQIKVVIDNKLIDIPQSPFIIDSIIYVPIREICKELGANVRWEDKFNHVEIAKNDISLSFQIGDTNCILNGKNTYMPQSIIVNDKVMLPLRFLSEAFEFNVLWNDSLNVAVINSDSNMTTEENLKKIINQNNFQYTDEDLYWLSRLVHAEAQGESYNGKLTIANVIINRTKSNDFPNSIKSVIFDRNNGVQFTSTLNGQIYLEPSQESTKAALDALNGNNNAKDILYFFNPKKSPSNWIAKNRQYAFTVENHNFYF